MYIIGLDFDGTCVTFNYPEIGEDIGALPVLKAIIKSGNKIVLNTMRSGIELYNAVEWLKENGIELYGVNKNPTQKRWTTSPKVYAHIYIDDAALGCPLIHDDLSSRPYVDWKEVKNILINRGIITKE